MTDITKAAFLAGALAINLAIPVVAHAKALPVAEPTTMPAPTVPVAETEVGASDIIVTARRIQERLQDVPISITVFNQDQLSARNVINAEDLATYAPSLTANTGYGSDNTSFAIRGFVQDTGTSPSVGVYFADVVVPRGTANSGINSGDGAGPGSFFDLQNVQVLKGPQGTLFGRNTTGGAVLLVPQKPTDSFDGYVEGSIGNYDLRRMQGAINLPLGASARLRIAGDHTQRDGYLHNDSGLGPRDFADLGYTAVRASLVVDLTSDIENYTIASYLHSRNNGTAQRLFACNPNGAFGAFACAQVAAAAGRGAGFYTVQNPVTEPYSKINQWQVINTTTLRASDTLTVKNIISYAEARNSTRTNYAGTFWPVGPRLVVPFSVIESPPGKFISAQNTFTEELRVQGRSGDGRFDWQAGGYFEYSGPLGTSGIASPVLLVCPGGSSVGLACTDVLGIGATQQAGFPINVGAVSSSLAETTFRDIGIYGQGSYKLTNTLSLTAGVRYTWDRQVTRNRRLSVLFPVVPPYDAGPQSVCFDAASNANNCVFSAAQQSSRPTWLAGVEYKAVRDLLLYAKYARGYRAGGVLANAPTDYRLINPEKVEAFEIGSKWSFGGTMRGTLNLAGFYNDFSNQQIFVGFNAAPGSNAPPTNGIVNAGSSRIYGVEVEAAITPVTGLTFSGSYTYLNATIRSIAPLVSRDPNYEITASIRPGDDLLLSPRHKASVNANYMLPLAASIGNISVGATFSYTARQLSSYDFNDTALLASYGSNLARLGSRKLLDLNMNWRSVLGSRFDVAAFATNVTNDKYFTYVPALGNLGFLSATLGSPRMYGMRARINFGD